jgi:hypothetical protein
VSIPKAIRPFKVNCRSLRNQNLERRCVWEGGDQNPGFAKMIDKVAGIEKKLGIYDLAQVTPKV